MVHRNSAHDADDTGYPKPEPEPDFETVSPVAYIEQPSDEPVTIERVLAWITENERAIAELNRAVARIRLATNRLVALRNEITERNAKPASANDAYDDDSGIPD